MIGINEPGSASSKSVNPHFRCVWGRAMNKFTAVCMLGILGAIAAVSLHLHASAERAAERPAQAISSMQSNHPPFGK